MTSAADPAGRWGLADRRLYLCTPDRPDLERFVAACIEGGVDIVQLREKHLPDAELVRRAAVVRQVCADYGVPFILNDRPDLARDAGADGVHVGQDDTSPAEARQIVGDHALIGLSTHATAELETALGALPTTSVDGAASGTPVLSPVLSPVPADYVSAGPVVATPTKPGRPGTGTGYLAYATARSPWTVWVTGGVDPNSVAGLVDAGARHFVVVRWLTESDDPKASAGMLRHTIDRRIAHAGPVGGSPAELG